MSKVLPLLLVFVCLPSCGPSVVSQSMHKAQFNTTKIESIELLIHKIGKEWDLVVLEKDKKFLEINEFLMAIEFNNSPVITVTNIGYTNEITVNSADFGEMPIEELEDLTTEILASIESDIGSKFIKQNATSSKSL